MAKKTYEQLEKELAEVLAKLANAEASALKIIGERDEALKRIKELEEESDKLRKEQHTQLALLQERIRQLEAEIESLRDLGTAPPGFQIAYISDAMTDEFNAEVRAKVQAGLTQEQAIEVLKAQAAEDARREASDEDGGI